MIEADLRLRLPCGWAATLASDIGGGITILGQKVLKSGTLECVVEIDPGRAHADTVIEALQSSRDLTAVDTAMSAEGRVMATLQCRECRACHVLARSEGFLMNARTTETGELDWHLMAPRREVVEKLIKRLQENGIDSQVIALRSVRSTTTLTTRQEKVTSLAYELGYFDFPKRIHLSQLAVKFGVSKSTLHEILRIGEAKVLHAYFQGLMRRSR